jgi:hypothetical protein
VLHGVLDSNFKLCAFVVNGLIKGEIEKPSNQFLGLIVMSVDLVRFEFEFGIVSFCFSFIFISFGESRLLVSWCTNGRCGMTYSDEDCGRSRKLGACGTPAKMTRANNVLKYQSLDQSPVQYIIQVVHSRTTLLFKYKTLQHDDDAN